MSKTSDFVKYISEAIQSDGQIYRQQYRPTVENLAKKKIRGIYQSSLAAKAFVYIAESGIRKFKREFSEYYEVPLGTLARVPATVKLQIAKVLLRDAMPEIMYEVRELKVAAAKKKKPVKRRK